MKTVALGVLLALTLAQSARATDPPAIPPNLPVVEIGAVPTPPPPRATAPLLPTLAELDRTVISGPVYYAFRRAVLKAQGISDTSGPTTEAPLIEPDLVGTVIYNSPASNDANEDVEPTVATINKDATDWTVSVTIKTVYDPIYQSNTNRLYSSRTTGVVPPSFSSPAQLQMPYGYKHASDPYLSENPYNSGIGRQTMYCVGILHQDTENGASAVAVWRSTDGGSYFQAPALIQAPDNTRFYDKPAITVSWSPYYGGAFLGRVWLAWVDVAVGNSAFNRIKVARSCDGAATFPVVFDIAGPLFSHGPQILADNTNDMIYVVYPDYAHKKLVMAKIQDTTTCSGWPTLLATEDVTGSRELITDPLFRLNRGVRALSEPVARFNFAARRIGVVWHELEYQGATITNAYFTTRPVSGGSWSSPVNLARFNPLQDQFMPALDADGLGNWVTSFYNRADDSTNTYYRSYYRALAADGSPFQNQNEKWISANQYDPQWQPIDPGFVGDYQDIWEWSFSGSDRWNAAWIRTYQSDNMVSGIQ